MTRRGSRANLKAESALTLRILDTCQAGRTLDINPAISEGQSSEKFDHICAAVCLPQLTVLFYDPVLCLREELSEFV